MVESRTDEKTIICCGHSVQAEKTIITSTRKFLGWRGIRRRNGKLYAEPQTYVVFRWRCPICGTLSQSGIRNAEN